jgi:hypothetical protein
MKRTREKTRVCVHPASIKLLTDATWNFARNILWRGQFFSKAEESLSKFFIREYYEAIPPELFSAEHHLHFTAYCERIMLAKKYVDRYPHRYIPHPCNWLNRDNPKGFAGTRAWYLKSLEKRKRLHSPIYRASEHTPIYIITFYSQQA